MNHVLYPACAPCTPSFLSLPLHRQHPSFRYSNARGSQAVVVERISCPRRQTGRGGAQVVSSFLGVGAPEALLVGVVALVVFGPKGLADAAKGVGKTLRSFQPTLQELSQVSNELKNTLQNEIGLDEFRRDIESIRNTPLVPGPVPPASKTPETPSASNTVETPTTSKSADTTNGSSAASATTATTARDAVSREGGQASTSTSPSLAATSAAVSKSLAASKEPAETEDIEKMRAESARMAWGNVPAELTSDKQPEDASGKGAKAEDMSGDNRKQKKALEDMTVRELEAELAKRKALIAELTREV